MGHTAALPSDHGVSRSQVPVTGLRIWPGSGPWPSPGRPRESRGGRERLCPGKAPEEQGWSRQGTEHQEDLPGWAVVLEL